MDFAHRHGAWVKNNVAALLQDHDHVEMLPKQRHSSHFQNNFQIDRIK